MSRLNHKLISYILGLLLLFNGLAMLVTSGVSLIVKDGVFNDITSSGIITMSFGIILMMLNRNNVRQINKRDGYLIVTLGWITMIMSGMLPYYLTGSLSTFSNMLFESMSGYTATGSTVISDIESLPESIIFWRSMTHWLGGMGIIVLAIAILPLLGIGGMQLFSAEAPGSGISGDKMHPRISSTAKRLWFIYVGLTFAETLALNVAGMSLFDSINHSMSNIATGGYLLIYSALLGKFKKLFTNTEFIWYLTVISIFVIITSFVLFINVDLSTSNVNHPEIYGRLESSFRHAFFQIVAIITTTGFVSGDFAGWTPFLTMLFFALMFIGASSGSTSGGIKISRHLILIKNGFLEFKKALHPNAVLPLRYNHSVVKKEVIVNILAFFMLYLILFVIGAGVLSTQGLDFISAVGGSAASIGNVGPAIGSLGPTLTYEGLSGFAKVWCSFLMLVGRLELFTLLIIFSPYFWKKN
jgi:trk system potassium uptake protein TrkH